MPFYRVDSDEAAIIVLEQVDKKHFRVKVPFRYVELNKKREPRPRDYIVPATPDWTTDLASVPPMMRWVVQTYGQQTLPAVLHDQILHRELVDHPEHADRVFRNAMGEQGVPLVMRWLMWAAVSLRTVYKPKVHARLWTLGFIVPWFVLWAATALRVTPPFAAWHVVPFSWLVKVPLWVAIVNAAVGPLVLGALWYRRYMLGVISGYAGFLFAVPILAIALATAVYYSIELALEVFDTARKFKTPKAEQRLESTTRFDDRRITKRNTPAPEPHLPNAA